MAVVVDFIIRLDFLISPQSPGNQSHVVVVDYLYLVWPPTGPSLLSNFYRELYMKLIIIIYICYQ